MKYKRLFSALAAVSILLCGCQKIENTDSSLPDEQAKTEENIIPLEEDYLTTFAKREEFSAPEGVMYLHNITPVGDGYVCIASGDWREWRVLNYNADFTDYTETVLVQPAPYDGYYFAGGLLSLGESEYYSIVVMENHSDMEPYSDEMDPEDYDWERYHESWESEYYLCTYAKDGTLADKVKVEGLDEYRDDQGYDRFSDFFSDGENSYLALDNGTVLRIGKDGTLTTTIPTEDDYGYVRTRFLRDRDGKTIYYSNADAHTDDGRALSELTLAEFDIITGKPGEPLCTFDNDSYSNMGVFSGGYGDYRIFINEEDYSTGSVKQALYGIRDDGEKEVVIDWTASDLTSVDVTPLADGSFIGQDYEKFYRITRKYASEIKESQVLRIGVLDSDYYIMDFVRSFNNAQDDYRLETVVYKNSDGTYIEDPEGSGDALDNLKLAVVSNDAPDLLVMDVYREDYHDTILKLGARGVFCDLYELMEGDTEVSRDKLLPNVLKAMEHPNGALYSLPGGFKVSTIAVKSKFTTKENWTMDDMIELYEGADDIMYYWSTKQDTLRLMMMGTDFTDELGGTCRFDSPEFVRMLEFCNRYPQESTLPPKNYDDPVAMEKFENWYYNSFHRYQNDEDYLFFNTISALNTNGSIASAWAYTKAELGGGDITLVGYPSDNGSGGKINANGEMAILNTCSDKAAAWEVLKAYIQGQEISGDNYWGGGYSVFEDVFEEQLDNEMYIWMFGKRSSSEYYDDDARVYRLTQEERDELEGYIRACDTYMMLDGTVESIVYEEADKYFRGESSAEDTAKMIQNRAELYLAEQS